MARKKKAARAAKEASEPVASGSNATKRAASKGVDSDNESLSDRRAKKKRKLSPQESAPKSKKAKGKAKAVEPPDVEGPLKADIQAKAATIAQQAALLASFKNSLTCNVCLDILNRPYTLACGHVFCRKCLIGWFHRPDPDARLNNADQAMDDSSSESDDDTFNSRDSIPDVHLPSDSEDSSSSTPDEPIPSATRSNSSSSSGSSSSSDSDGSSGEEPGIRGQLLGRSFDVNGGNDDATWDAMERQFHAAVPTIVAASDRERGGAARPAIQDNRDEMRQARLARFGQTASTNVPPVEGAVNGAGEANDPEDSSSTARASSPVEQEPQQEQAAPPADAVPAPAPQAAPPPAAVADEPHVIPRGEHRLKNLICPQCRVPTEQAPFRVFVLSEMVLLLRSAESNGILGTRSGSADPAAPHASTSNAAAAPSASHVDSLPGLDDNDLTWGGLFTNEGKESALDQRKRYARVVEDRDDGVRRCFMCNWEIDEDTGICNGCGREWDLGGDGRLADQGGSDDDSGESVGFVLPWGGSLTNRRDDETDSSRDDEEESHNSFIVGSDEGLEQVSDEDDIVFPDDPDRDDRRRRKKDKKKEGKEDRDGEGPKRKIRRVIVDSDDPEEGKSSSSDESSSGSSSDEDFPDASNKRRAVVISSESDSE